MRARCAVYLVCILSLILVLPQPTLAKSKKATTPALDEELPFSDDPKSSAPAPSAGGTAAPAAPKTPITYIVQKGDTLWGICIKFMGDPFYWPKLWYMNNVIRNPHLIYPGQIVRFIPGDGVNPPRLVVGNEFDSAPAPEEGVQVLEAKFEKEVSASPEPLRRATSKDGMKIEKEAVEESQTFEFSVRSMITETLPEGIGEVTNSSKVGAILSYNDTVYLEFDDPASVSSGDVYTIFSLEESITQPDKFLGPKIGYLISLKGTIQVTKVHQSYVSARVNEAFSEMLRGDRVMPYVNPYLKVKARQADYYQESQIIAAQSSKNFLGEREIVYILGGKNVGMKVGDTLNSITRGDYITGEFKDLPSITKGKMVVAMVFDKISMALTIDTSLPLEIGDKLITDGMFTQLSSKAKP